MPKAPIPEPEPLTLANVLTVLRAEAVARDANRLPFWPRLLTKAALRNYLGGLRWTEIQTRMQRGQLPRPLWNQEPDSPHARWDLRSVDRALDATSSIPGTVERDTEILDRAFAFTPLTRQPATPGRRRGGKIPPETRGER